MKYIRLSVTTDDGRDWESSKAEEVTDEQLAEIKGAFSNFTDLTGIGLTGENSKVFFNPAHVMAVKITVSD